MRIYMCVVCDDYKWYTDNKIIYCRNMIAKQGQIGKIWKYTEGNEELEVTTVIGLGFVDVDEDKLWKHEVRKVVRKRLKKISITKIMKTDVEE